MRAPGIGYRASMIRSPGEDRSASDQGTAFEPGSIARLAFDWLALGIFEWRTGTPWSIVNEALDFVGVRNSERMPDRAKVELGLEHRFVGLKWKPWIGIRAYNAFNAFLPSDVQANLTSPAFGSFYNSEYRQLRVQLRFER